MNREDWKKKIYEVILESTETEVDFDENTLLAEDMGLSSMEFMILLTDLEEELDIEIPMDRLMRVNTVGSLCDTLLELM